MRMVICTRPDVEWGLRVYDRIHNTFRSGGVELVTNSKILKEELNKPPKPDYVFFLHWSWWIDNEITDNFNCISFHSSDLPKGRGGSPIQNQIMDGLKETKISAFKTTDELDAGDIYLKRQLPLEGDLKDIYSKLEIITASMIEDIISKNPKPKPQIGKPTYYKRRTPEMSEIDPSKPAEYNYNLVRCLNMEPYPHAFIRCGDGKKLHILEAKL